MDFASYDELARLTAQAQSGSAEAFNALYEKTAPILRLAIASKVGFAEADDILQEVYLVAWRNVGKIDPRSVVAYLNTTARNLCSNHLRRQTRDRSFLDPSGNGSDNGATAQAAADHGANPADILAARDVSQRLRKALVRDLDDQERNALLLRYFLNLKNAEVADQLGVSERTAKRIIARALSTLRHKLAFIPVGADLASALAAAPHSAALAGSGIAGGAGAAAAGSTMEATTGAPLGTEAASASPLSTAAPENASATPSMGSPADCPCGNATTEQPANADRRWRRTHQMAAAAAVVAVLGIGLAAAALPAPPNDEPSAPDAPETQAAEVFPACESTGTAEGFTWVRVAAGTHPVDRVWCTDAQGSIHLPLPVDDTPAPLANSTAAPDERDAASTTYVFDLPSGSYELHATDTAGNESHGPLEVTLYPEP
ncbi:sigma-70 family RNA polymerase sigma factor [Adlercreutzia sp. R7]|uniref:Sigma-70 family RNA polymerase sigma factor n=1 Tax=Adlercreutzia wanghongyangiae TaxID=3111451 RepID=A0ABU6IGS4_9ACTN|nr:sigma-70 family RNA polymerase sigma factor [Adlercreutzia sp. R7]